MIRLDALSQEIGRFIQTDQVTLVAKLLSQAEIQQDMSSDNSKSSQYFVLQLDDGSEVNFRYYPSGLFQICGLTATWPKGLDLLLQSLSATETSQLTRTVVNASGNGLLLSGFQYGNNVEASGLADAYIDLAGDQSLYLSGNLQLGNRVLVQSGPIRDLQVWQNHFWLINQEGQVIRLGGAALGRDKYGASWKLEGIGDLSQVVEKTVVDPGPTSRLRAWQGKLLILRPDSSLEMDGQTIQTGVKWFEIDSNGLFFLNVKGLGRLSLIDTSQAVQYWAEADTLSACPSGEAVCYSNSQGVFCQPMRDEAPLRLTKFSLDQLTCDGQGYCYGINDQGLWQIRFNGQSRLLRAGRIRTFGLGQGDGLLLFLEETADTQSQTELIKQYSKFK